jgi:predicted RNA-binding protein
LLLLPQTRSKPFHKAPEMKKIRQLLRTLGSDFADNVHVAVFCAPFGVVPLELDEVYPLSQHEAALPLDKETIDHVAEQTVAYIKQMPYSNVTMLNSSKLWEDHIKTAVQNACKEKGIAFDAVEANNDSNRQLIANLKAALLKQLGN